MSEQTIHNTPTGNKLVVVLSRGLDDERATVAWTLAATGVAAGQDVTVFLVSAGVDLVRRGAADLVQMNPNDPSMKDLIKRGRDAQRIMLCHRVGNRWDDVV